MPKILSDVKNILLEAVEKCLRQGGYSAVTIRSVAQGCGVSTGTVYNYFPSKEALLAEYLLVQWRQCMQAIEETARSAQSAEPVARCIYEELIRFARANQCIFQDEGAKGSFAGSFGHYHAMLRSQLAAPLEKFWAKEFGARFAAEALLTWSMAGMEFWEIWGMLSPTVLQ